MQFLLTILIFLAPTAQAANKLAEGICPFDETKIAANFTRELRHDYTDKYIAQSFQRRERWYGSCSAASCYKDNRDMIANVLSVFDANIAQLEEARDAAETMEKATSGKESSMDSLTTGVTGTKAAVGAAKGKTPKIPSGKGEKPASSITGDEEDAKKRKK